MHNSHFQKNYHSNKDVNTAALPQAVLYTHHMCNSKCTGMTLQQWTLAHPRLGWKPNNPEARLVHPSLGWKLNNHDARLLHPRLGWTWGKWYFMPDDHEAHLTCLMAAADFAASPFGGLVVRNVSGAYARPVMPSREVPPRSPALTEPYQPGGG